MNSEFSKTQFLKDFFTREVVATIFLLLAMTASAMWVSVMLKSLDLPKYLAFAVFSVESFLFIGAGILFSVYAHSKTMMRTLWLTLMLISLVSWGYLSVVDVSNAGALGLVAIMFGVGCSSVMKDNMWAHVMGHSQAMKYGSAYLALQMIVHTVCNLLGTAGAGFLADISFNLLAMVCFGSIIFALFSAPKFYPEVKHEGDLHIWHLFHCPKKFYLLMLSATHNMLAIPIRYIIVPLYFYDKSDGDLRSVGVWLGLVALFALFGNVAKRLVSQESIPTFKLMIIGVIFGYIGYGVWWLFFDSISMALLALLISSISSPIWSYGYFSELNKLDTDNGSFLMYQWSFINSICIGLALVVLFVLGYSGVDDFMTKHWIGFYAISGTLIALYFAWWWKRQQ